MDRHGHEWVNDLVALGALDRNNIERRGAVAARLYGSRSRRATGSILRVRNCRLSCTRHDSRDDEQTPGLTRTTERLAPGRTWSEGLEPGVQEAEFVAFWVG